jgi:hypothetical protein
MSPPEAESHSSIRASRSATITSEAPANLATWNRTAPSPLCNGGLVFRLPPGPTFKTSKYGRHRRFELRQISGHDLPNPGWVDLVVSVAKYVPE